MKSTSIELSLEVPSGDNTEESLDEMNEGHLQGVRIKQSAAKSRQYNADSILSGNQIAADEPESGSSLVEFIVNLQSLLQKFVHPKIRADFMTGKLGDGKHSLSLLDMLKVQLFPQWNGKQKLSIF